ICIYNISREYILYLYYILYNIYIYIIYICGEGEGRDISPGRKFGEERKREREREREWCQGWRLSSKEMLG
ncbi:hypothetical protein, partial [Klebsiella pneumoniae]|uniref:hypothetical protein n=1 Tax=Klebsiella pneumoniae TaxID=573 RepID=UPI001BDFF3B7